MLKDSTIERKVSRINIFYMFKKKCISSKICISISWSTDWIRKKIFWKNVRGQCPRCALHVELSVTHSSFFLPPPSFVSFWFSLAQGSRLWATLGIPLRRLGIVKRKLAERYVYRMVSDERWMKWSVPDETLFHEASDSWNDYARLI